MARNKGLFSRFTDPDRITFSGLTPLQKAVLGGKVKKVHILLKEGADPNFGGLDGANAKPLALAVRKHNIVIMRMLLKSGAKPDGHIEGISYLCTALTRNSTIAAETLINHGAKASIRNLWTRETAYFGITSDRFDNAIRLLSKQGVDINATDCDGCTPLYKAVTHKNPGLALSFLRSKADPNILPEKADPLLKTAMDNTDSPDDIYWALSKQLLWAGADGDAIDRLGRTFLHRAVEYQDISAIRTGANKTGNYRQTNNAGDTILHEALRSFNYDVIKPVLALYEELPANKNNDGQTVMDTLVNENFYRYAREDETFSIIEGMFKKGGNPDTLDETGQGLIHYAVDGLNMELLSLLLRHNADIDLQDTGGSYPLLKAVEMEDLDLVDTLLDYGANPNIEDDRGWTLLDNLSKSGDRTSPLVQRLIASGGQYKKQLPASEHVHQYHPPAKPDAEPKAQDKISKVDNPRHPGNDNLYPRPIRPPRNPPRRK